MIAVRYNETENSSFEAKEKAGMAKITVIKGEEFKIAVKEKITQDDLFIEMVTTAIPLALDGGLR